MGKKKELSDDLKPVIINLALKGYFIGKIANLVNKSHYTVQYIINTKYTTREQGENVN
ncbi:hypothetical protein C0J52_25528 [Blattella germanica]|nr:hypothetical protein C0J52_25528 [Blattella germanica]